jgi:hypothetical protein
MAAEKSSTHIYVHLDLFNPSHTSSGGGGVKHILIYDPKSANSLAHKDIDLMF